MKRTYFSGRGVESVVEHCLDTNTGRNTVEYLVVNGGRGQTEQHFDADHTAAYPAEVVGGAWRR